MKRKLSIFTALIVSLCACNNTTTTNDIPQIQDDDPPIVESKSFYYGAFLGRNENNLKGLSSYQYVSLEIDEFKKVHIQNLDKNGTRVFAYLNVGSLETYRDYYNQFKDITFADYENWEDERWIKISDTSWQNFVVNTLAKHFKEMGAYGVYMDNIDVYTVWSEQGHNKNDFVSGIRNIIKGVNDLGLKVMVNGGSEFFDDMLDRNDEIIDSVYAYHQEEVFSLIDDYDDDVFTNQCEEDKNYYQEIASRMKAKGKEIFFLEYTKDPGLEVEIRSYCEHYNYHYYISKTVDLI